MLSNKVEKKLSLIHGYGLFVNDDVKKGEILWTEDSNTKKITLKEFNLMPDEQKKEWITYSYYYDDFVRMETDDAKFWNHSFDANSIDGPDGDMTIVAAKDLKSGEELTWDYSKYLRPDEDMPDYMTMCDCGHKILLHHGKQKQKDDNNETYIRTCYGIACVCTK